MSLRKRTNTNANGLLAPRGLAASTFYVVSVSSAPDGATKVSSLTRSFECPPCEALDRLREALSGDTGVVVTGVTDGVGRMNPASLEVRHTFCLPDWLIELRVQSPMTAIERLEAQLKAAAASGSTTLVAVQRL